MGVVVALNRASYSNQVKHWHESTTAAQAQQPAQSSSNENKRPRGRPSACPLIISVVCWWDHGIAAHREIPSPCLSPEHIPIQFALPRRAAQPLSPHSMLLSSLLPLSWSDGAQADDRETRDATEPKPVAHQQCASIALPLER